ncbi:hypothetical protein [Natrarchaeobaculum aegyptiacum]|uniref:Uncharacterized protein n=1 Tax=Natrarchaeobaculum aegyptiacum TaxID=745377 RepID=A0A2Z2HV66_9EURY|nr:hypothetical protein [Natrarchaeobaculum aegyptiacum]ARS91169.1 hypothetical protein B1756_16510 [Natrarchaeobaculum aegyptiacum]
MNLDELRSVQSTERQKDSLQNLRPSFYREVGEYIADLEAERDRIADQVDDPFSSPEVSRLTDEIETARDVVEAIYERRMGKLVKQASLAAAGLNADDEGLTAEEEDLFEDLVSRIESNKSRVLDVLEVRDDATGATASDPAATGDESRTGERAAAEQGGPPPAPPDEPLDEPSDPSSAGLSPADAMGGDGEVPSVEEPVAAESETTDPEPPAERSSGTDRTRADGSAGSDRPSEAGEETEGPATDAATTTDVDRVTVKITRDLGSILGVDAREYTLETDDVVTLPEENATPLVEREAAERLE